MIQPNPGSAEGQKSVKLRPVNNHEGAKEVLEAKDKAKRLPVRQCQEWIQR